MNSTQVASALRREKELLEQILSLAECQTELSEAGRIEDLEILLSLRAGPLSELEAGEEAIDAQMRQIGNLPTTTEDLQDLHELNIAISSLVERIVNLDEKTEWLADHSEAYFSAKEENRR
jgi:hypothetical protein